MENTLGPWARAGTTRADDARGRHTATRRTREWDEETREETREETGEETGEETSRGRARRRGSGEKALRENEGARRAWDA